MINTYLDIWNSLNVKERLQNKILAANYFIAILSLNIVEAFKILFLEKKLFVENFVENFRKIIWTCLPIATLTVSTSSIVYSIHVAPESSQRGLDIYLGGLVALSLIREGVPVMGSLAVITQYCSGMTAQIGSMKVTEQIDAMKMSRVNPSAYFLLPMILAGLVGFPLVIIICILMGLFVSYISSNLLIDITFNLYSNSILHAIRIKDIAFALTKASIFGFFVTLVSYICGIMTVGGSKAVGNSTRLSVIINFALVIILDYLITALWI